MAQRGGSVESHVRFGRKVFSPLIEEGKADFLVPFHKGERDRLAYYLSAGAIDMIEDLFKASQILKDKKFINTYMLGALSKHLKIGKESWLKALEGGFKGKFIEENRAIFEEAAK
jgi:indolepyruvate ferredoxin oxidoreductase beta subunit